MINQLQREFLIFSFLFFWLSHILRRNFFWLYFWERRGSRLNRFINAIKENPAVLFPKISIISFLILPLFLFKKLNFLFGFGVYILYLFFGLYSIYLLINSTLTREFTFHFFLLPKFKRDTVIIFSLLILIEGIFLFHLFPLFFGVDFYFPLYLILLFEISFPFLFVLILILFNFFDFFFQKIFEIKAKRKISKEKNLIKIGICGSYGKTLTKEFLYQILKEKFKVLKTEGGEASLKEIVGLINKKLKKEKIFIFEISAYKKGEVRKICDILKPDIVILTGISHDHIALFGNFKNILNVNFEAFSSLKEDGVAILNIKDKEAQKIYQRINVKKYSYSLSEEKGDVFVKDINIDIAKKNTSFTIVSPWGEEKIVLNFPFREYIENFLGAFICAVELGFSLKEIVEISKKISLPERFMTEVKTKNGIVIDDTSSHTPKSFLTALDYIDRIKEGKKIIITSAILELGKTSSSLHNNIGKKIGEVCDFAIFTTPLFSKEIKLGAFSSGMKKKNLFFSSNPKKILSKLKSILGKNNIILLEGEVPEGIRNFLLGER